MNKDELQLELDLLLADKLINRGYLDNIKCINWAILNEMKMLLFRISKGLVPDMNLIYCNVCNDFSTIEASRKGWLLKTEKNVCSKCKSTNFISWNNMLNQKRMLELLIKR